MFYIFIYQNMTEIIDWIDQTTENGESKKNIIQTTTNDDVLNNIKDDVSTEDVLEEKLELLHMCLVPSQVPTQLSKELSMYTEAFELFKQTTKGCSDSFDDTYVEALRKFRDILLENI